MSEFINDLKYYCSSANEKSKWTYRMIVACLILLPIAAIIGIVAFCIRHVAMPLIIGIVCLLITVALVIWLIKS